MSSYVVALDVGGTAMKGAVVDRAGVVRHDERRPTGVEDGVDAVAENIVSFAADLFGEAGTAVAVGAVAPGLIDEAAGVARYAANLGWRDLPLRSLLSSRLGVPAAIGHDVRAGALAESLVGAGRGRGDFLFLPIGTGIAAGMVIDGSPYAGVLASGGEIGHIPVIPDGEPCACGQRGCLETYASAAAVSRRYAAVTGESASADAVVARAVAGDAAAVTVWDEAVHALTLALTTYTLLLDPTVIVIGGGLAGAGDALFGPLAAGLKARLAFREPPPLVPAVLGDQAGALGAAILAWRAAGVVDLDWSVDR